MLIFMNKAHPWIGILTVEEANEEAKEENKGQKVSCHKRVRTSSDNGENHIFELGKLSLRQDFLTNTKILKTIVIPSHKRQA